MDEEQKAAMEKVKALCDDALSGRKTYEDAIDQIDDALIEAPAP